MRKYNMTGPRTYWLTNCFSMIYFGEIELKVTVVLIMETAMNGDEGDVIAA